MTEKEILEGNKLIAEFLGITIITDGISFFDTNYKPLRKYNIFWDDLMPVVEKIENLDYFCMINKWTSIYTGQTDNRISITTIEGKNKLLNTYIAVLKFIKWYNNEQINKNK